MAYRYCLALLMLCCCCTRPALADSDVTVKSLVMPAWVQHEGKLQPLVVGMPLVDGDRVTTGGQARVLLHAADGSDIKLGEYATLTLTGLSRPRNDTTLFTALLDVARGAFRFTTAATAKLRNRDVTIRVAEATIGIRGTDVWGKDGSDKRVVCLIEGKITVQGKDNSSFIMDQAMSFYDMPKDQPAKPVAAVSAEQLGKWALETEIVASQGAATQGGQWQVRLMTLGDAALALSAYDTWRDAGYNVTLRPIGDASSPTYQLRITHLASRADAAQLAQSLKGRFGADTPTVSR